MKAITHSYLGYLGIMINDRITKLCSLPEESCRDTESEIDSDQEINHYLDQGNYYYEIDSKRERFSAIHPFFFSLVLSVIIFDLT